MERGVSVKGWNASRKGFDRVDRVFFLLFSFFCIFYVCTLAVLPVNLAIYIKGLTRTSGSWAVKQGRSKGKCSYFWLCEQGNMVVFDSIQFCQGGSGIAAVAQLVERVLGKDEVMGPSPISSS